LPPPTAPTGIPLFTGYNEFYQRTLPSHRYNLAWNEFQADARMHALGARLAGKLVGMAHFLVADSPGYQPAGLAFS